ncbi:hypothetical protein WB401_28390 [Streptomyces brasiliscabiei]|uniref:hypothetical protein n=1 Tax=Streptomyces TaxID=1883 RepID=UPI0030145174
MAHAGFTNGAFYAHFDSKDSKDSKDDLVATAVADQLRARCEAVGAAGARPGRGGADPAGLSLCGTVTALSTAARRPPCSTRSPAARTRRDARTPAGCSP